MPKLFDLNHEGRIKHLNEIRKIVQNYATKAHIQDYHSILGGLSEEMIKKGYGDCTCRELVYVLRKIQEDSAR